MQTVLVDCALVSVLLLIGYALRKHVVIFQKIYIPASLLGGFVGLIIGPQVLGRFSDWFGLPQFASFHLPIDKTMAGLPGVLISIVMALTFLGTKSSKNKSSLPSVFSAAITYQMQILVGLIIAFLFMASYNLPMGFGLTGIYGFFSGHGTAAATGAVFKDLGWDNGPGIAITIATTGLLSGIVVGMIYVNIGIRKGWARMVDKPQDMPVEARIGYIEPDKRKAIGWGVSYPDVLDPLALQVAICLIAYGGGIVMRNLLIWMWNPLKAVPLFATCMLSGVILNKLLLVTNTHKYTDRATIQRVSGFILEILVCAAVATTPIQVFTDYWFPILVLTLGLMATNFIICIPMAYKMFPKDWFEGGIGCYGTFSGVLATGLMLVRSLDPNFETEGSSIASTAAATSYSYMVFYIAFGPALSYELSPAVQIGVTAALVVILFIIIRKWFWLGDRKLSDLLSGRAAEVTRQAHEADIAKS